MKKFSLISLLIFYSLCLFSQTRLSPSLIAFTTELKKQNSSFNLHQENVQRFPVSVIKNVEYVSVLAVINDKFSPSEMKSLGVIVGTTIGKYATLKIPVQKIDMLISNSGFDYLELAPKILPCLDKAIHDTSVDSVHAGWNLPQPYTGKNVLIGITDWGFDYTNPMFYDTSLTQTRIVKAWDQYRNSEPHPEGYDYGTEFTGSSQLLAAQCDTFNIYEYATHGSHVAGITGGSGAGTAYRGVAFEAEYIFATFLVDAASLIDAVYWMKTNADAMQKRLVINMSWGLYYMGNLDNSSVFSSMMQALSEQGVVFVTSAGNNGSEKLHIKFQPVSANDTMKTQIKFDSYASYPKMWGQSITIWGTPEKEFSFSVKLFNTQNQLLAETPFYSTSSGDSYEEYFMVIDTDTIFYNIETEQENIFNHRPHVRLRVRNLFTSKYKTALFLTSDSGATVHLWNVIELVNGVGNWGLDFAAMLTGWKAGDSYYSVGEPACAEAVISVGAYSSRYQSGSNFIGGAIASFSSYGPTLDERMKPDIAAPGVNVCSSISSFTNAQIPGINVVTSVVFNGRTYKFVRFSGTSMSSPMVTGIVALMLEANPSLTPLQIKQILKHTAREDSFTGDIPPSGDLRWGWGKVNALHAIYEALGIDEISPLSQKINISVYPNPVSTTLNISCPENFKPVLAVITTLEGKIVQISELHGQNGINVSQLNAGKYNLMLTDKKLISSTYFLKI